MSEKHHTKRRVSEDRRGRAEVALEAEREQLLSIFDSIDEAIYVIDPDSYELLYVNDAFRRRWGEGVGTKCYQTLHRFDRPCPFCSNDQIFGQNAGRPYIWEFQSRATGRWFHCIDRAIRWPDGRLVRYEMAIDITERKQVEEVLRHRTHELGERVKELNCLFGLSKLVEQPDVSLDEVCYGLLDIMTASWQYPEVTCARVFLEDQEFETDNFRRTEWSQSTPITARGKQVGVIEVYYLEEKPTADEGPFCREERSLLEAVAGRLGRIVERIWGEQALRRERDFAESLIQTAQAVVTVLDTEGRILRINPYLEEITGRRLKDVKGKDWFATFLPDRSRARMRALFRKAIDKIPTRGSVVPIITEEGDDREIAWYDKPLEDADGKVVGLLAIGHDLTDRRRLEREVLEIGAREQQRIGRELHDGLGQELTGLGYLAETLYCELHGRQAAEAETADRLASGIQRVMDQVRAMVKGLVPAEIHSHGLAYALQRLASDTQGRFGIPCRFFCGRPVRLEDTYTAAHLFRIAQEAVNNAAKHGQPEHIEIDLREDADGMTLEVRDDGMGMSVSSDSTAGMGLNIMRYRADLIGATLDMGSADGGGTRVTCGVPRE